MAASGTEGRSEDPLDPFWADQLDDGDEEGGRLVRTILSRLAGQSEDERRQGEEKLRQVLVARCQDRTARAQLREILEVDVATPQGRLERWEALVSWLSLWSTSAKGELVLDFSNAVHAEVLYGAGPEGRSPVLDAVRALADMIPALREAGQEVGYEDAKLQALSDVEIGAARILKGQAIDLSKTIDDAYAVIRATSVAQADADGAVHWVKASMVAGKYRLHATRVRRFCETHKIRTRQGRTAAGKPHPQRLEVDLEAFTRVWKAVDAAAERKLAQVQEAIARAKANRVHGGGPRP